MLLRVLMYCLLVIASGWAASAAAGESVENARWVDHQYGTTDGLPVDSANGAVVDMDGFLWLATHDGLARFDGAHFEIYDSLRFPAMTGNRVLGAWRDAAGRVFAHTEAGDWLRVESEQVRSAFADPDVAGDVRFVDPANLCVATRSHRYCPDEEGQYHQAQVFPAGVDATLALAASDDRLWLLSRELDVWRFEEGQWQRLWRAGRLGRRNVQPIGAVDGSGRFWLGLEERLLSFDIAGNPVWMNGPEDPQGVYQLRVDAQGQLWVGARSGLYRQRGGRIERLFEAQIGDQSGLSWEGPDAALWVLRGDALYRLEPGADLARLPATPVLRSSGQIKNMAFGPDGLVWIMTLQDGLHRLNRARVERLAPSSERDKSNVYGVSHAPDGTTWMGTLGSGLLAVGVDGSLRTYGVEDGLPGVHPWVVNVSPLGEVYTATYAPGLWRMPVNGDRFEAVLLPAGLRREPIRALVFSAPDTLWLGSSNGVWKHELDQWHKVWPEDDRRVRVSALVIAQAGIWLGSDEGVWRLENGQTWPVAAELLAHTSIRGLDLASDGAVWISTDGRGLVRVAADDPLGEHPLQLTRQQGLPSNTPHAVVEDAQGHFWVNSNQGIFRISRPGLKALLSGEEQGLAPLLLGLSDGLPELEGNGGVQPSVARDARGRLLFASQNGVVRVDPMAMPLYENPPRTRIGRIEHEGVPLALDAQGRLPQGMRNLRFHYGAADLVGSGQSRYRYRMLPSSSYWSDALNERSVQFNALAPGRYRFEVRAGNSDGIWAQTPSALEFTVPAYWYETGLFRLGLLALGLLLVVVAVHWRLRQLHHRALALDLAVRTRTQELRHEKSRVEQAMAELTGTYKTLEERNLALAGQAHQLEQLDRFRQRVLANVSHELRTPIMLVGLPLEELECEGTGLGAHALERLQLARRQLERLQALVEQLVGLIQAESGQMPLRLKRVDLERFCHRLVCDYGPKAELQNVQLQLHAAGTLEPIYADPAHLATIFGNLLDNALKHAPPGSPIRLDLEMQDEGVCISVSDQGSGFDPALASRLFERFYRAQGTNREGLGIGLSLVQELVRLHGGHMDANSHPGAGACFRVWLPGGSEHVALQDLTLDDPEDTRPAVPAGIETDAEGCILLVEDHPDLANYLVERLGNRICTRCVHSVEEALPLLANNPRIRLVISDVMLPGRSGIDLCQDLKQGTVGRQQPVILISARAVSQAVESGLAAGAAAYLTKPFGFDALVEAISQAWPAARSRFEPPAADPQTVDSVLKPALEHLHEADFSMTQWAELVHLSSRQLRRRVNALTGQTPQNWLREQRLLRVHQLLREGQCKTLLQAGQQCGLENPSYLYRSYRARFGDHQESELTEAVSSAVGRHPTTEGKMGGSASK